MDQQMQYTLQLLQTMQGERIPFSHVVRLGGDLGHFDYATHGVFVVIYDGRSLEGISIRDYNRWYFPSGWDGRTPQFIDFFTECWDWKCAPKSIQEEVRRWHKLHPKQVPHDKQQLSIQAQQHATAKSTTVITRIYHTDVEKLYTKQWLPKQKLAVLTAQQRPGSILHRCMQQHPLYERRLWFAIFEAAWPRPAA